MGELAHDAIEDGPGRRMLGAIHPQDKVRTLSQVLHVVLIGNPEDIGITEDGGDIVKPGHETHRDGPDPGVGRHHPDDAQAEGGQGLDHSVQSEGEPRRWLFRVQAEGRNPAEGIGRVTHPGVVDLGPILRRKGFPQLLERTTHQPEDEAADQDRRRQAYDQGKEDLRGVYGQEAVRGRRRTGWRDRLGGPDPVHTPGDAVRQPQRRRRSEGPKARHQNELTNPPHPHV